MDLSNWLLILLGVTVVFMMFSIFLWWRITLYQKMVYRKIKENSGLVIFNDDLISEMWWDGRSIGSAAISVRRAYMRHLINKESTILSQKKHEEK